MTNPPRMGRRKIAAAAKLAANIHVRRRALQGEAIAWYNARYREPHVRRKADQDLFLTLSALGLIDSDDDIVNVDEMLYKGRPWIHIMFMMGGAGYLNIDGDWDFITSQASWNYKQGA